MSKGGSVALEAAGGLPDFVSLHIDTVVGIGLGNVVTCQNRNEISAKVQIT